MKLKLMKNAVTRTVARQLLVAKKHSPTIMFVGGVTGSVVSTVLACKATLELEDILDESDDLHNKANTLKHRDYSEEDRRNDKIKITLRTAGKVAKLYAPAAVVGVASIAALTGSHVSLSRRNAAVVAAYSALDKGFKEYRERVREEVGDEKELALRHGIETVTDLEADAHGDVTPVDRSLIPSGIPSVYARFFDEMSSSWSREPEYNRFFLNCQQNYWNDILKARGHVFLNEVYDSLGISRSKAGAVVGWVLDRDGDNFIDFGIYDDKSWKARQFVNGDERSILLDFNVDGVIYDKIGDE